MLRQKPLFAAAAILIAACVPVLRSADADVARPAITGLAHVALFSHNLDLSRQFYKDFLGYDEPFSLKNPDGSIHLTWFKINDRQFIEIFPEKEAGTDRLYQVSFETENAEQLRAYLQAKGVKVPAKVSGGRSGTVQFTVKDPDGHTVEFVQYLPGSWVAKDMGKHLSAARIGTRMPHAGIMVHHLQASLDFYCGILGFKEFWRGSKDGKTLSWVNVRVPEGEDYAELMLYTTMPALARIQTLHHVCIFVPDVPKAGEELKARPMSGDFKPPTHVAIGVNGKRQINYYDPDGTRVEIMEPNTHNGLPVPPSTAPPPG